MRRTASLVTSSLLLLAGATLAVAQDPFSNAKAKAQKAAAASNAHTAAEQNVEPQAKTVAPVTVPPTARGGRQTPSGVQRPGSRLDVATADIASAAPTIMREVYVYPHDGRRDPFISLLTTTELRPALSDLRLTTILFDQSGNRSVAILRDLATNAQYRVSSGSTLGRMRVSAIRVKSVVFTIDEFGTTRQDSLVLGDSTKVRK